MKRLLMLLLAAVVVVGAATAWATLCPITDDELEVCAVFDTATGYLYVPTCPEAEGHLPSSGGALVDLVPATISEHTDAVQPLGVVLCGEPDPSWSWSANVTPDLRQKMQARGFEENPEALPCGGTTVPILDGDLEGLSWRPTQGF